MHHSMGETLEKKISKRHNMRENSVYTHTTYRKEYIFNDQGIIFINCSRKMQNKTKHKRNVFLILVF